MEISRIGLFTVDLPYAGGTYRISGGRTYESFSSSIVRILGDDGIECWGRKHDLRIDLHRFRPGQTCRDR
jgi:hypothetical protein